MGTGSGLVMPLQAGGTVHHVVRGDVYEMIQHDRSGSVFRTVRRNTTFELYCRGKEGSARLNYSTKADGYLLIEADLFEGREIPEAWKVVGIFVPIKGAPERKAVAEAVRRRFGPESVLLAAPLCGGCSQRMEEMGDGLYHCKSCRSTKQL